VTPQDLIKTHGSLRKAADAVGMPKSTLHDQLRAGGKTPRKRTPALPLPRGQWRTTIAAAHKEGRSVRVIAAELDVPKSTLFDLMITLQVP